MHKTHIDLAEHRLPNTQKWQPFRATHSALVRWSRWWMFLFHWDQQMVWPLCKVKALVAQAPNDNLYELLAALFTARHSNISQYWFGCRLNNNVFHRRTQSIIKRCTIHSNVAVIRAEWQTSWMDTLARPGQPHTQSRINWGGTIDWWALEAVDDMPPPHRHHYRRRRHQTPKTVNRFRKVCQTHYTRQPNVCARTRGTNNGGTAMVSGKPRWIYWNIHTGDDRGVLIINRFKMVQSEALSVRATPQPLRLHAAWIRIGERARGPNVNVSTRVTNVE